MKHKDVPSEKTYHLLYKTGLVIKGIIALSEVALGILFYSATTPTINNIFNFFAGDESTEKPSAFYWHFILHSYQSLFTNGQSLWAFIFVSHGLLNLFLVFALLKNKLWAYPAAAIVFSLFVIYQLYNAIYTPSISLVLFTIFDAVVIALILHEYKRKKKLGMMPSPLSE